MVGRAAGLIHRQGLDSAYHQYTLIRVTDNSEHLALVNLTYRTYNAGMQWITNSQFSALSKKLSGENHFKVYSVKIYLI